MDFGDLGDFFGTAAIHLHFASALIVVVTKKWQGHKCFLPFLALHTGCMTQLLLLGKVEYGGGPIFKVVLEC